MLLNNSQVRVEIPVIGSRVSGRKSSREIIRAPRHSDGSPISTRRSVDRSIEIDKLHCEILSSLGSINTRLRLCSRLRAESEERDALLRCRARLTRRASAPRVLVDLFPASVPTPLGRQVSNGIGSRSEFRSLDHPSVSSGVGS